MTGDWDWADRELRSIASAELDDQDRAAVLSQLVTFGALKGADIESDLEQFRRLITGTSDLMMVGGSIELNGILAWVAGRLGPAHVDLLEAARLSGQYGPARYPMAARVALWAGDVPTAVGDLEALEALGSHGPVIDLRILVIRAGTGQRQVKLAVLEDHAR